MRLRQGGPALLRAWASINKRSFSIVLINMIHELWNLLHAWDEGSAKVPLYYLEHNTRVQVMGAAPFSDAVRTRSIDISLNEWITRVNSRFPGSHLEQANSFSERIPDEWQHIFAPGPLDVPGPYGPADDAGPYGPTNGPRIKQQDGNPDDPASSSYNGSLLEKIPRHADSVRSRNKHCVQSIRPFPRFQPPGPTGESLEICFGASCKGLKCLERGRCNKWHLDARGSLRSAPFSATADIRAWLIQPAVRQRIRLTDEAKALRCFQGM